MHGSGRALDIFIPLHRGRADNDLGDPIANWLVQHASEIGVQFIIWDRTKWNISYSGRKDREYAGSNPHIDHLHVELSPAGARGETAWFRDPVDPDPDPTPVPDPTPAPAASCLETCRYAGDGECDDGGPGSLYSVCELGTDCADCGPRGSGPTEPPPVEPPPVEPPPAGTGGWAGLDLDGMSIPRRGLANDTLRRTLGIATEPLGDIVTHDGRQFVLGTVSWFGGPRDTGVAATETGAVTGEVLRRLNDPMSPSAAQLAARPQDFYYVAMRWKYSPQGVAWLRSARMLVVNPSTGASVVVRPVDWGPHTRTGRIVDLSPQALHDLGLETDGTAIMAWATPETPLGPVR
jgi:hypothetical protein